MHICRKFWRRWVSLHQWTLGWSLVLGRYPLHVIVQRNSVYGRFVCVTWRGQVKLAF